MNCSFSTDTGFAHSRAKKEEEAGEVEDDTAAEKGNDDDDENKTEHKKSEVADQDSAVKPHGRDGSTPSNILEKGIIYFFFRGRIGIDHPDKVSDIARSYIILRPIPKDAKLGDGPIGDAGNSRLIAVPKKVLPQSGRDRWIAFVEKSDASFDELKKNFLASNDYQTKAGIDRHSPAASPFGEGVYAITTTGRESHLAYMLTLPKKLDQVQTKMGLKEKGSWIISTRNPQYPAPANTQLPESPKFSKDILDEFRSLRWMGTLPKHLIPNAQFLLVGESSGIDKALQPDEKDKKDKEKEEPVEEMERLEEEDAARMEHLGKDAAEAVFADLEAQAKGYPELQTTF
ncbi:hypothetical protein M406DRAFT_269985 [Cryphonectria parasitica EP155]|uniref:BTB domain transcription factor n=1 Tax=Cryphonectria parasitica (strain ATCC 38755 / EP155) TaxID=660469 RepID=A0A9P4XSH1_CRYP1|nr:uncharacterized protein M406DRAFT_269985 [Cryphonectria parasitica EP155]KAF3759915.1 hypothetical protein M406DRAFT_269985 [Cryphonectria parasitica EP155]